MSKPAKQKSMLPPRSIEHESAPSGASSSFALPVKQADNSRLAPVLLLVALGSVVALLAALYVFSTTRALLLAVGIIGAAAVFGLTLWLWSADNRMNRKLSRTLDILKSVPSPLEESQALQNIMQEARIEIKSLHTDLDTSRRMTETVHKIVTRPGFPATLEQLDSIKKTVEFLQSQINKMERKLDGPLSASPPPPKPEFDPVGTTPPERLEKALAYYELRLLAPGNPAQADLTSLKQAAQDSLAMEKQLSADAETLLNPADLWIWDILNRDVFAAPILPVGLQEIPEDQAKPLSRVGEELTRYRRFLVQLLETRYGVKRIETLPNQTKFDPALHRADEFSKVKTTAPHLHLLIADVRAAGFMRHEQVMRKPQVTYYVYTEEASAYNPISQPDIPTAQTQAQPFAAFPLLAPSALPEEALPENTETTLPLPPQSVTTSTSSPASNREISY